MLCNEFINGAEKSGHDIKKINVHKQKIATCMACYACKTTKECVQKDDMKSILEKMIQSDIIVLSTPVYFYSMNGQLKTLIDRTLPRYTEIINKDFYFIATAAEEKDAMERTIDAMRGFTDCLPGAKIKCAIYGSGAWQLGDIRNNKAMKEAYEAMLAL